MVGPWIKKLPISYFNWIENEKIDENFIKSYDFINNKGYAIEVDLDYPDHLHDKHNDHPLALEHLVIGKIKKISPNFNSKKNYVFHIANLQYSLSIGMNP